MLRHLAGTIILILFGISCAEQRSWTEVTFEHDSYIKVPLTINGDVHWYIFDTGAGVSTILSELAVSLRKMSIIVMKDTLLCVMCSVCVIM